MRGVLLEQEIHGFCIYKPYLTKLSHHGMVAHCGRTSSSTGGGSSLSSGTGGRDTTRTSLLLH